MMVGRKKLMPYSGQTIWPRKQKLAGYLFSHDAKHGGVIAYETLTPQ